MLLDGRPITVVLALPPSARPAGDPRARLYDDPQKSLEWLARRPPYSASRASAPCGISPYEHEGPFLRYEQIVGITPYEFDGNEDTEYGELHEPHVRDIGRVLLVGVRITEYGLFVDAVRPWMGASPDGETSAFRLCGYIEVPRNDTMTGVECALHSLISADLTIGKAMYEVKCSKRTFYAHPQVAHLAQLHQQMWVRDRRYGVLHYFHKGLTRMWLVRFHEGFWLWCRRRCTLHHAHCERRVPLSRESPYFRWLVSGTEWSYMTPVAKWLHREWYTLDGHTGKPLRAPCTADDWRRELASLGFSTDVEFAAAVTGGGDVLPRGECDDGQLATPPEPPTWLLYEQTTQPRLPASVSLFDADSWLPRPEDAYTSVVTYARAQLAAGADRTPYSATMRMRRFFVTDVLAAPELDEPEPRDMRGEETPAEREEFNRRLAELRRRPPRR